MKNSFPAYPFILTSFFISGASSLFLQVAWQRVLYCYVGVALPTVVIIVSTSMAGLAFGAVLAGQLLKRKLSSLNLYALAQLLIAACALTSALAGQQINALLACINTTNLSLLSWVYGWRLALAELLLFVPILLIGASFPFLSRYLYERGSSDEEAARIYSLNLLGSAGGAVLAGFVLIPIYGVQKTLIIAAAASFAAAVCLLPVYLASFRSNDRVDMRPMQSFFDRSDRSNLVVLLVACGALSMVLEMLWTRLCMLIFAASTYAFAITLSCQLLGLALGGSMATRWLATRDLSRASERKMCMLVSAVAFLATGTLVFLGLYFADLLPWAVFSLQGWFASLLPASPDACFILSRALVAAGIILLPCICVGGIFPILMSIARGAQRSSDFSVVTLYAANSWGAMAGCVLSGLLMLPIFADLWVSGLQMSLFFAAIFSLALALVCLSAAGLVKFRSALLAVPFLAVPLFFFLPKWDGQLMCSGISFMPAAGGKPMTASEFRNYALGTDPRNGGFASKNLFYREGLSSTVTVGSVPQNNIRFLKTDGKMEAAIPEEPELPAPTSDVTSQVLLGSLPVLLCPTTPKNALLIGLGSGVTAGAILDSSEVGQLVISELEKSVVDALPFFSKAVANYLKIEGASSPLDALPLFKAMALYKDLVGSGGPPLVTKVALDGRSVLSLFNKQYEVVVSQPGEPWLEGSARLYTKEFFELVRKRLAPGGVFCQWIQLYNIDASTLKRLLSTFQAVFPDTLVFRTARAGEVILIAFNVPIGQRSLIDVGLVRRLFNQPSVRRTLGRIGIHDPDELLANLIIAPEELNSVCLSLGGSDSSELNFDDLPAAEFSLPASLVRVGSAVDRSIDQIFRAKPFTFARVYRPRKEDLSGQATEIACLALAYQKGGVARPSPAVATSLMDESIKCADRLGPRAAQGLLFCAQGKSLSPERKRYLANWRQSDLDSPKTAVLLAQWFSLSGRPDLAKVCLSEALKKYPDNAECLLVLGQSELKAGRATIARDAFRQTLVQQPDCPQALVGLARAMVALGDYQEAMPMLKRALQIDPGQFEPRFLLGKLLCVTGQAKDGLAQIVWASRQEPANAEPNLYVTAYYVAKLQWEAASKNLSLLLDKLPNDSRVQYLEAKIRTSGLSDKSDTHLKKLLNVL